MENLKKQVSACTKCKLSQGRNKTVFGEGAFGNLMIIGEAPGKEEDESGRPFVGRSGKLLTAMLESIDFYREDVYITNTVKCRPPQNRTPELTELKACRPYLEQQILHVNPKMILCLGKTAYLSLFKKKNIEKLKPLCGVPINVAVGDKIFRVFVTYHPSALLRNSHFKKAAKIHLQKMRMEYDNL